MKAEKGSYKNGDKKFEFYHIQPRKLLNLKIKLGKIIGGGLGQGFNIDPEKGDIGALISGLANVSDEVYSSVYFDLLQSTIVYYKTQAGEQRKLDGIKSDQDFDIAFSGDDVFLSEKVLVEALKVYFGNFGNGKLGKAIEEFTKKFQVQ